MTNRMTLSSLVAMMFLMIWALAGCSLFEVRDPKAEISATTVIVEAGKPVKLLQTTDPKAPKIIVVAALLKDEKIQVKQDISGWVAMPPSHWEQVKAALDELAAIRAKKNDTSGEPLPNPK